MCTKRKKKYRGDAPPNGSCHKKKYSGEDETESRGGEIQEGSERERKIAYEQRQVRRERSERSCQGETEELGGRKEVRTEKLESEMNP